METITDRMGLKAPQINVSEMDDDAQVFRAVQQAVADSLRSHEEKGHYIVVSCADGKPVIIQPQDIVVPEVEGLK